MIAPRRLFRGNRRRLTPAAAIARERSIAIVPGFSPIPRNVSVSFRAVEIVSRVTAEKSRLDTNAEEVDRVFGERENDISIDRD